jgi:hypothetical protein
MPTLLFLDKTITANCSKLSLRATIGSAAISPLKNEIASSLRSSQ